uniref:Ig-like domain-containing protein n=1 Tax=Zonotrichia albicollis TaxID=44394 RepID=A0A8D2M9T6_ZONAL
VMIPSLLLFPAPSRPVSASGRLPWSGPTLALASWCPLSPAGAQTTQFLVEPPWRPAVLWDRVTLTCQGSGTAGDTTLYKDKQRTHMCDRPGTGCSPPCHDTRLVLQVLAQALLQGDTVTLLCMRWWDMPLTEVRFYHGDKEVGRSRYGAELSLSPLQLHHSGHYTCRGWVDTERSMWAQSVPVTVTVHGASPFCVPTVPVANATITLGPLSHRVHAGDPVTLRCSVQVGSAPVTFTWLHNGQEVAWGPLLELRDIDVGH